MLIIGCDYHPSFQQVAFLDTETGESGEGKLGHKEEAEKYYGGLKGRSVRVGMEATGHARWFERLLGELNFELWVGDPATIQAQRVRRPTVRMPDTCCVYWRRDVFPGSGYPVQKSAIYGNCCGTGIVWCR